MQRPAGVRELGRRKFQWRSKRGGWGRPAANALLLMLLAFPTLTGYLVSVRAQNPILTLGWTGVVPQTAANTCGPAVIATLLAWGGEAESDVEIAAAAELREEGVTLAEFERLADHFGFPGRWYRVHREGHLEELPVPSVVHLRGPAGHYAILVGKVGKYIRLADPARGLVFVPAHRFLDEWTGRAFLFEPEVDIRVPISLGSGD